MQTFSGFGIDNGDTDPWRYQSRLINLSLLLQTGRAFAQGMPTDVLAFISVYGIWGITG